MPEFSVSVPVFIVVLISACGDSGNSAQGPGGFEPENLSVTVLGTIPHDTGAYTQGFELHDGVLWESSGLFGQSTLRKTDPAEGSVISSYPLPDSLFAEGLTIAGDTVYQLTWRSGLVLKWSVDDPVLYVCDTIETQGWGICAVNSTTVATSDGSSTISFRDVSTFETVRTVDVTLEESSIGFLNELEYAGGEIYANRYYSDYVYRIDPDDGTVTAIIDASSLRSQFDTFTPGVLNGIAWDNENQLFYMTGKNWPTTFIVTFD